MEVRLSRLRDHLSQFKFLPLFVNELGWDYHSGQPLLIPVSQETYILKVLAQKHGMVVYSCQPNRLGEIPNAATRCEIDQEVTKYTYEHLIVYSDAAQTRQIWQWVKRVRQQPVFREYLFCNHDSRDFPLPMLELITFSLDEEVDLTLVEVTSRVKRAFDQPGNKNQLIADFSHNSVETFAKEILHCVAQFRLVSAKEEIELAYKIAELLESEEVREQLAEQLDRKPLYSEWADAISLLQEDFKSVLNTLSDNEWNVLWLRYEFYDSRMQTLEELDKHEAKLLIDRCNSSYQKLYDKLPNLSCTQTQASRIALYVSLHRVNLTGGNLQWINLNGGSLQGVNLKDANLQWINLKSADLSEANLSKANLNRANLSEAKLDNANLSEVSLNGAALSGSNLNKANLNKAKLCNANLSEAKLCNANLSEANLYGAKLWNANLSEANLKMTNLSKASLNGANLSEAQLCNTNLSEANLNEANLSEANLNEANLSEAELCNANLNGANLSKANLNRANLCNANLQQANLSGAVFQGAVYNERTKFPKGFDSSQAQTYLIAPNTALQEANLEGINLGSANLLEADLSKGHLLDANLSGANLQKANLQKANLQNTNLRDANLQGANLSGANLQGARLWDTNLTNSNLQGANLRRASLWDTNLKGANLEGANLQEAELRDASPQETNDVSSTEV